MTRKHFKAIADALRTCKPDAIHFEERENYQGALSDWRKAVNALADVCAQNNINFRRSTFLDACGFDD